MKKLVCLLLGVLLPLAVGLPALALDQEPEIYGEAAILMDAETGQILYGKNEHKSMEPASLTKIMTCLLALENSQPQDQVTTTRESLRLMWGATSIDLYEGETLPMEEMLYALMLPSANDAANAIAVHLGGSIQGFAAMMNEKAQELGLADSVFRNPSGLPARGHVTSAYDLAQITRAAMEYPAFLEYAGTAEHTIPAGEQNDEHELRHLNYFLRPDTDYYQPDALAGKTGWTEGAGNCLMTIMERDGRTLIAVVLKSDSDEIQRVIYRDTMALFEYGFGSFQEETLTVPAIQSSWAADGEGGTRLQATATVEQATLTALVPAGETVEAFYQYEPGSEGASVRMRLSDGSLWPWPLATAEAQVELTPLPAEPKADSEQGNPALGEAEASVSQESASAGETEPAQQEAALPEFLSSPILWGGLVILFLLSGLLRRGIAS